MYRIQAQQLLIWISNTVKPAHVVISVKQSPVL